MLKHMKKKIVLALGIIAAVCLVMWIKVYAANTITVYFTVEKFTIGQGYLVEPEKVTVKKGTNCAQLFDQVLKEHGYTYEASGSTTSSFYLRSIHNADTGNNGYTNIPECVQNMGNYGDGNGTSIAPPTNKSKNTSYPSLGEFDYNTMSGWMYSVNGKFPMIGMQGWILEDGDVVRVQFTVFGYGLDLGSATEYSTMEALNIANKDSLTVLVAAINQDKDNFFTLPGCKTAYNNAMNVLTTLDSTQQEVDNAWRELPDIYCVFPTDISMDKEVTINLGASAKKLSVTYQPSNTTLKSLTWTSSNSAVAVVDSSGSVSPVGVGTAVITAKTVNGKSASCTVTVVEVPLTKIELNTDELYMETDTTKQLEVASYVPNDTSDAKTITWSSSDASIAEVDSTGKVTAYAEGIAVVTAQSVRKDVKAVCIVNVVDAHDIAEQIEKRISNLPDISNITLEDVTAVQNVYADYQDLSDNAMTYISDDSVKKLLECVGRAEELTNLKAEADKLTQLVNQLPILEELTLNDEESVQKVQNIYVGLSDEAKQMLDENTVNTLQLYINKIASLHSQVTNVEKLIKEKLGTGKITFSNYTAYETAMKAYLALPKSSRIFVSNADILNTATSSLKNKILTYANAMKKADKTKTLVTASVVTNFNTAYTYYQKMIKLDSSLFTSSEKKNVTSAYANIPVALKKITVSKIQVEPKKSTTIKVKKVPTNATYAYTLTYKSSNTKIAKVSSKGKVTGVSEGKAKITVTATLKADKTKKYTASCTVAVTKKANALSTSVKKAMEKTRDYILKVDTNPDLSSQWNVIGLVRSGMEGIPKSYYNTFYKNVVSELKQKKGVLTQNKYSDYSKLIISMTAIGKDARDIAGYNLLSYLADFENVRKQGFNGPIWALIALNSNPEYEIPTIDGVQTQTTRQGLIDYIVNGEVKGGGWTLMGDTADVDMTGMAIQALAPYYGQKGYSKVTKAVNRALTWLSSQQSKSTGGYSTYGVENSESTAQVIVALCALGVDPKTDSRFLKAGYWTIEALLEYYVKGGGFMHVQAGAANNGGAEGGVVDGMATEQGFYALAAYTRLRNGKTALYDMSDLTVKAGKDIKGNHKSNSNKQETDSQSNKQESKSNRNSSNKNQGSSGGTNTSGSKSSTGNRSSSASSGSSTAINYSRTSGSLAANSSSTNRTNSTQTKSNTSSTAAAQTQKSVQAESSVQEESEWSFSGDTYVPNFSNQSGNDTVDVKEFTNMTHSLNVYQIIMFIETFILGIVLGAMLVLGILGLRKRKAKKLGEK